MDTFEILPLQNRERSSRAARMNCICIANEKRPMSLQGAKLGVSTVATKNIRFLCFVSDRSTVKYFDTFLRPQGSLNPGDPVIPHPSYDQMSTQSKTDCMALADHVTKNAFSDLVKLAFETFVGSPYKAGFSDAARAALRITGEFVTLSNAAGELPTNLNLVLGKTIKMAGDISGQGSVDTYRAPFDKLDQAHVVLAERQKVRDSLEPLLKAIGVSKEDGELYAQWLSNPDASLWKSVGEGIRNLQPEQHLFESMIFLNAIGACSPVETAFTTQKRLKDATDALFEAARGRYEETLAEVSQTHAPNDAYNIAAQDAFYEILLRLSFGIEGVIPDRQLLPRQTSAAVVIEAYARLRETHPPPPQSQ